MPAATSINQPRSQVPADLLLVLGTGRTQCCRAEGQLFGTLYRSQQGHGTHVT